MNEIYFATMRSKRHHMDILLLLLVDRFEADLESQVLCKRLRMLLLHSFQLLHHLSVYRVEIFILLFLF